MLIYSLATYLPTGWPKNGTVSAEPLTLSNINRFSKFFRCQNQEKICNNIITKDPSIPQVCGVVRCGGIFGDIVITNFLLILTVKDF